MLNVLTSLRKLIGPLNSGAQCKAFLALVKFSGQNPWRVYSDCRDLCGKEVADAGLCFAFPRDMDTPIAMRIATWAGEADPISQVEWEQQTAMRKILSNRASVIDRFYPQATLEFEKLIKEGVDRARFRSEMLMFMSRSEYAYLVNSVAV